MYSNDIYNVLPDELKEITTVGNLPAHLDNCLAIIEDGGTPDIYFKGYTLSKPVLKIVVRHLEFETGFGLVEFCKNKFKYYHSENFDMILVNEPLYFGRDNKHRNEWQLTFKIIGKD